MEAYQIINGFSDIKSELRTKANLKKEMNEISLWFGFKDRILYVHDVFEHFNRVILAVEDQEEWSIYLEKRYGKKLIEDVIRQYKGRNISERLNELYKYYGYSPFSRF